MELFKSPELLKKKQYLYSGIEPLAEEIMLVFNRRFNGGEDPTRLLPGTSDPEYLPRGGLCDANLIFFAHGFAASALHEVAHWCIAGADRRKQIDYGYWYVPDGRDLEQQEEFFQVEAKPQALEWLFSIAVARRFFISCDNLSGPEGSLERMRMSVRDQVCTYIRHGLPLRAKIFLEDLTRHFLTHQSLQAEIKAITTGQVMPT